MRRIGSGCLAIVLAALAARAEQLPIKTYTIAEGLVRENINRIVRDSRGFLWFCTTDGVSRFDGYRFTNYRTAEGLPHGTVLDVLEGRDGTYWFATAAGLARLNPTAWASRPAARFDTFKLPDANREAVRSLREDPDGSIWCATESGLYRLTRRGGTMSLQRIDLGDTPSERWLVFATYDDRRGGMWIVSSGGILRRDGPGRVERVRLTLPIVLDVPNATLLDRRGHLWIATADGAFEIDTRAGSGRPLPVRIYDETAGLGSAHALSLFETADGRFLIGTGKGFTELSASGAERRARTFHRAHGLSDDEVSAFAEDIDGNIWLGSRSGGAMKMARSGFVAYHEADGLARDRIAALFESRGGELYAITDLAINRFDGQRFHAVHPRLPSGTFTPTWGWNRITFEDSRGAWWMPTTQGLLRYPPVKRLDDLSRTLPDAVYTSRDGLSGDTIFRLYEDRSGDVWITTLYDWPCLTRWDRETGTFRIYSERDGLVARNGAATAFAEDRAGNLWLGFYTGGLARYRNGQFTTFDAPGFHDGMVRDLHVDSGGSLWMASTGGGLFRIDDPIAEQLRFTRYTAAAGLATDRVATVMADGSGTIYAGGGRGLNRLDARRGEVQHYTTADGLPNNLINVALRDSKGVLWFGTLQGLARFIPLTEQPRAPLRILIVGVAVDGAPLPVSELGVARVGDVILATHQRQIAIDFAAVSFVPGERVRYQYKLEGSGDWGRPTFDRTVIYGALAPGPYRFLVRALGGDGLAAAPPAVVEFRVIAPLWKRWWVLLLAAVGAGLALHLLFQARLRRLLELERVRTRIASDLHDDIGATLSQISVLSELAQRRLGGHAAAAEPLTTIGVLSRDLIDSLSDIVWTINPQRDSLGDLVHRMRRFVSDAFASGDVTLLFDAGSVPEQLRLGPDTRRETLLIFKEAVNNALRHSRCGVVEVTIEMQNGVLGLTVRDDGRGFDTSVDADGNGLVNMQRRAAKIGGALHIASASGAGTTIQLRVPVDRSSWRFPT